MSESYWQKVTRSRVTRRRALAGASGLGAGAVALSLVGCGGGESESGGGGEQAKELGGLLHTPKDTTSSAKAGGTFKSYLAADVPTFDLHQTTSFSPANQIGVYGYQRLFKYVPGKYPEPSKGDVEGDAVESYEYNGDKTQLTLKIRPNLKLDPRAPTSGRLLDAEDVKFSWNRFASFSPFRTDLLYDAAKTPESAIESVSTPDKFTAVLKLHQPDPELLKLLAFERLFWVMPREADGGFDPRGDVRGSGPYTLQENRPSAFRVWAKNPDYYVKGRPFPDRIEQPIVTEYASRLAQFKAGNIWPSIVVQEDAVPTKRDNPVLLMVQADAWSIYPTSTVAFGFGAGDTPWKDERMRQAVSMVLDRELVIDVIGNRETFAKDGVDIDPRYNTVIGPGAEGYWLDPKDSKKFGEWSKVYTFNVAEAKKLMSAAGFPNGVDTLFSYNGGSQYGASYTRVAELLSGMLTESGIRAKLDPREYQNDWVPNYHYGYTKAYHPGKTEFKGFTGLIYRAITGYPTVPLQVYSVYNSGAARFQGMTPNGLKAENGDAAINDLTNKIRREFDAKKQQEMVHDLQQQMAKLSYDVPFPYSSRGVGVYWPVIGNLGAYRAAPAGSAPAETAINWWIDDTQPPLKKA